MQINFRNAKEEDSEAIFGFISELAEFEKLSDAVISNPSIIEKTLFGENPPAKVIIAEYDGKDVGFALYFFNYSTFLGKRGFYLEDLYVKPEFRKLGIGKALLSECAKIAVKNNCGRMEWSVLDWNPAREFYEHLGAFPLEDWTVYRITGQKLEELAKNK
jgi:GNAT superfamily N-acetyltransferase